MIIMALNFLIYQRLSLNRLHKNLIELIVLYNYSSAYKRNQVVS